MCKILVVEHDSKVREAIQALLTDAGYIVETAGNSTMAIEKTLKNKYDLAIVDLNLNGGLSGFDFIEESNGNLEYIVLTGVDTKSTRKRAKELGVQEFMPKPYDEVKLIKTVDKYVYSEPFEANIPRRSIGQSVNLEDIHNRVSVLAGRIEHNQVTNKELTTCLEELKTKAHKNDIDLARIEVKLETALEEMKKCPARGEEYTKIQESVKRTTTNWQLLTSIGINIIGTLLTSAIVYLIITQFTKALGD